MSLDEFALTVVVPVYNLAISTAFYEEALGLHKAERQHEGAVRFQAEGNSTLEIYVSPSGAGASEATLATWTVDDLDQEMTDLRDVGVVFEDFDFDEFRTVDGVATDSDGNKAAWFKDPDGNYLCLHQFAN